MRSSLVISLAFVAVIGAVTVEALDCYFCTCVNNDNPACLDPMNTTSQNVLVRTCPSGGLLDIKEEGDTAYSCGEVIFETENEFNVTQRGCASKTVDGKAFCDYVKDMITKDDPNGKVTKCSLCDSDKCNS